MALCHRKPEPIIWRRLHNWFHNFFPHCTRDPNIPPSSAWLLFLTRYHSTALNFKAQAVGGAGDAGVVVADSLFQDIGELVVL